MDARTGTRRWADAGGGRRALASALLVVRAALLALVRFASWAAPDSARPAATGPAAGERGPSADAAREPDAAADTERDDTRRNAAASSRSRRLASSLVFAALFFSGAALSAVAGDTIGSLEPDGPQAAACIEPAAAAGEDASPAESPGDPCESGETGETATETSPEPEAPPAPGDETGETPPVNDADADAEPPAESPGEGEGEGVSDAPAPPPAPAPVTQPNGGAAGSGAPPVLGSASPAAPRALDPEAAGDGAVVWLHRVLPDPTPPARRLAPAFARELRRTAAKHGIGWSLVLAVVRAHGNTGRVPVGPGTLDRIAGRLAAERDALGSRNAWHVALRYSGRTAFADRTLALDRYNRGVGLRALVTGLEAAKDRLARRVLADPAIEIYTAGRADIAAGRTDVRIVALLRYLRIAHGSVTVSSLTSGHGIYARPGVVSAHVYGLAVDIVALGGRPILGNQAPGGVTERAVRDVLLLPAELRPQQVISLLGLGGPSFPLADHGDHIHVGY